MRNIVLAIVMTTAVVAAQAPPSAPPPTLVKVRDDVFVIQNVNHVVAEIGQNGGNATVFLTSDGVILVDTKNDRMHDDLVAKVKSLTDKPIRYAILTHYHGDHSLGSGVFAKEGTILVAHETARKDFDERNVEGYLKTAERDPVYAKYKPTAPQVTFTDKFIIDDGRRRLETHHFGHAHTRGCSFPLLTKERIVFTGDACVNGPFNYCGDSDTASWIEVLAKVQALDAETVVPAHGAAGKKDLLETQRRYFAELRAAVAEQVKAGKSLDEAKAAVDVPMWREWTGEKTMIAENIAHVYKELTKR